MSANSFIRAFSVLALLGILNFPARSNSLPPVPVPQGFVESSSLVPVLKAQALQGRSARARLIGIYLLPAELANILHGTLQHLTIFCRAYVNDEFRSPEEAKELFRGMIGILKRDQPRSFDLLDPEVSRIVQRYVDLTKRPQAPFVNMIGAVTLGSILDTDDIYAMSMIVSKSASRSI